MKGIILAGGSGTRLYPITLVTSKQLLPIYDKPMVYYPISTLMLAGIKDFLIISTPYDLPKFKQLLRDGSQFGVNFSYIVQEKPEGLAQAFVLGKDFIGDDACAMALGDNIFYGGGLTEKLEIAVKNVSEGKATIFCYYVNDPQRFGVVEFDDSQEIISIEEKPLHPKSNYCVTGLYFYPKNVASLASQVNKSSRGEYEITSLNEMYLKNHQLKGVVLGRGFAWFDTGTVDSLIDAAEFVQMVEKRQSIKISAPEEIAFRKGWIYKEQLINAAKRYGKSPYGEHLMNVANGKILG